MIYALALSMVPLAFGCGAGTGEYCSIDQCNPYRTLRCRTHHGDSHDEVQLFSSSCLDLQCRCKRVSLIILAVSAPGLLADNMPLDYRKGGQSLSDTAAQARINSDIEFAVRQLFLAL